MARFNPASQGAQSVERRGNGFGLKPGQTRIAVIVDAIVAHAKTEPFGEYGGLRLVVARMNKTSFARTRRFVAFESIPIL